MFRMSRTTKSKFSGFARQLRVDNFIADYDYLRMSAVARYASPDAKFPDQGLYFIAIAAAAPLMSALLRALKAAQAGV